MDEVFGRRDMITPARLKELSVKSDRRGWLRVGGHLGALALSGIGLAATWGTWWMVPFFAAHGILINFLYAGQHELSHWTVFATKRLNEVFGRAFGFVLLYPRDFDQIQHFAHHRYTQDWEGDGELGRPRYTLTSYLLWVFGPTYWYTRVTRILRFTRGIVREHYIPKDRHADVVREARWHVAGYAGIALLSVATGSWLAVQLWLLPMLVLKPVHQLQNTIEHLGLPHVDAITQNTRTTRTNAVMRWLSWNMQYHTAHHAFPGVPCYTLPKLHQAIFVEKDRKPPSMSYLGFQWAVVKAFWNGRTEADYPDETIWIADDTDLEPVGPRSASAA
ncbi:MULTISPECIES: fatty acid desaturase [unclassified Aureimonas]|uniref:fatty acid desaturase n=1 Tax=unclassified Aureimonas TaxID=2615206 RepID=UPI0006FAE00F|nr:MULTISPECIES: fatty acid desaturase [unclassified Aureimonas]KQT68992.1 rhizopine catabolism protein [Aureimonas sp. Leaf460]KQT69223.1 rhizopine catabolism protein [Aureimonas sp. Leaf427]